VALRRDEDRLRDTVDLERVWLGLEVTLDLFVLFWERLLRAVDLLRGLLWLEPRLGLLLKVLFRRFSILLEPWLLFLLLLLFFFVNLRWVLLRAVAFLRALLLRARFLRTFCTSLLRRFSPIFCIWYLLPLDFFLFCLTFC